MNTLIENVDYSTKNFLFQLLDSILGKEEEQKKQQLIEQKRKAANYDNLNVVEKYSLTMLRQEIVNAVLEHDNDYTSINLSRVNHGFTAKYTCPSEYTMANIEDDSWQIPNTIYFYKDGYLIKNCPKELITLFN